MTNKRTLTALPVMLSLLFGGSAACMAQQPLVFEDVTSWANKNDKDPTLVADSGDLAFDDAGKKLVFKAGKQSFDASYESVGRVVFDQATHMRSGPIWVRMKRDHGEFWMYVECTAPGGSTAKHMLQLPEKFSAQVLEKSKQVFAGRVTVTDVRIGPRIGLKTLKETLKDYKSKHTFEIADWKNHPVPELKPDKALIVVVCPLYVFHGKFTKKFKPGEMGMTQMKIHVNDRVVIVNRLGTYGFAYLDPGDYQIISQAYFGGSSLQTKVEAGKAYYFLQDDFDQFYTGADIQLSQHSPELVMHKLSAAPFGVWTRKSD